VDWKSAGPGGEPSARQRQRADCAPEGRIDDLVETNPSFLV